MRHTKLATRISNAEDYIFKNLAGKIAKIERETGKKVLNLAHGVPDIPPSPKYVKKLEELVIDPENFQYPPYGATVEFGTALIGWYQKRFGVQLERDELYPIHGAKEATSLLPLVLMDKEHGTLVPDPGYPGFSGFSNLLGIGQATTYDLVEKNEFKPDLVEIENRMTAKSRVWWLNFPANPTGQVSTREDLETYVAFAKKQGMIIIYDNAYSEITFDDVQAPSILEIPGAKEVAVEIGSFSKAHSFAGLRMGWVVGNSEIILGLGKIKSQFDSGMYTGFQKLGAYALAHPDVEWRKTMINTLQQRRDQVALLMKKLGLSLSVPKGALYLWAKIPNNFKNSEEFANQLLRARGIAVTPGTAFGKNGERFIRISFSREVNGIEEYL